MKLEEQFLCIFIIISVLAKVLAVVCKLVRQPKVIGELFSGVLLGPTAINIVYLLNIEDNVQDSLRIFSQIGVVIIIFYAAFTIENTDKKRIITGIVVGVVGVIIPFISIMGMCVAFGLPYDKSIFIGLSMSATSIAVSVQTLKEIDKMDENSSLIIIATVDDIMVIICLSIFTAVTSSSISEIGLTVGRMIGFFMIFGVGAWILRNYISRVLNYIFRDKDDINIILVSIIFGYALIAEMGGKVSMITGAFLIGIIMKHTDLAIDDISNSLFVTIFFASIGIFLNLRNLTINVAVFAVALLIVCILSKVISGFLGGILCKNNWRQSLRLGFGMVGRAEVGLILATQGIQSEIIDDEHYTVLILVVIISTILTPALLRMSYKLSS